MTFSSSSNRQITMQFQWVLPITPYVSDLHEQWSYDLGKSADLGLSVTAHDPHLLRKVVEIEDETALTLCVKQVVRMI